MNLQTVILGIVGAVVQLIFMYVPQVKTWYQAQPHQGLIMLGVLVVVSAAYFGLSCTSFAAQLGITLSCTQTSAMQLIQIIVTVAVGNQLTYLFAPSVK